jgi:hypothetical protein
LTRHLHALDASDGHRDHARIRDATLAAAKAADVPRGDLHCLPRSLIQRRSAPPDAEITTVINSTEHRTRALALLCVRACPG